MSRELEESSPRVEVSLMRGMKAVFGCPLGPMDPMMRTSRTHGVARISRTRVPLQSPISGAMFQKIINGQEAEKKW